MDLIENFGLENDGHARDWSRQVTCLNWANVVRSNNENDLNVRPGDFAENILIDGMDLAGLLVDDFLRLGDTSLLQIKA